MRSFVAGTFQLMECNVVQYTCECDNTVHPLHDRMLDCYCQTSPYSQFAIFDAPYVAKNSEKNLAS